MTQTSDDGTSVVVLGAGYAGVIAANRLWGSLTAGERARVAITLVSPTDRFVHRIRLHEHAAGVADAALPLRSMIPEAVRVELGLAVHVDADARTVLVRTAAGERELAYDRLVYAVGSRPAEGVRGVAEHAVAVGDLAGATAIRERMRDAVRVVVVGGGPAGVETAAELADAHPRATVTLLTSGVLLPAYREASRRGIRRSLRRLGVRVCERMPVAEVVADGVLLCEGAVPADAARVPERAVSGRFRPHERRSLARTSQDPAGIVRSSSRSAEFVGWEGHRRAGAGPGVGWSGSARRGRGTALGADADTGGREGGIPLADRDSGDHRQLVDRGPEVEGARPPVAARAARPAGASVGTLIEADLVVWAAGFEVPDLARRSGLPVDGRGRLLVDERLECVADAHIVGG
ncbi:FAD-dependent oxidoreductase, partial [Microbacterium sp.]|uniref:FAD-dependent oxidoreductase n=1 Tax=Microbacterium sp. TaxID=51671 RepID=UPI0032214420